jgi:hypothetical protein
MGIFAIGKPSRAQSIQSIMGKFELAPASNVSRSDISWVGMRWFEQDSHAGDAVLIAPVSSRIPCKQGIFRGTRTIGTPEIRSRRLKAYRSQHVCVDSLVYLTGNPTSLTGYHRARSGNSDGSTERGLRKGFEPPGFLTLRPPLAVFGKAPLRWGRRFEVSKASVRSTTEGGSCQVQSQCPLSH